MTPIEKAAKAIVAEYLLTEHGKPELADDPAFASLVRNYAAIIRIELKRELDGHASTMTREQAQGWQKCLRFLGVKE